MAPPHLQTAADVAELRALEQYLPNWPQNVTFRYENSPNYVPDTNVWYCVITAVIAFTITSTLVCARLWIRSKGKFGADDWAVIPAFLGYCTLGCINIAGLTSTGLGYHMYDLAIKDINSAMLIQYLHSIFWTLSLHLTRVSILYLLLRLTPHTSPKSRLFLHLVIAASYSFIVVNLGIIIFECKPITAAWDIKSRLTPGTCLGANTINLYAGLCAGHIVLDMMTILPPIPIIARLSMSRTKKLNLYLLLALGLVSVCCTSVRMFVYYRKVVQNYDKTRDLVAVGFYGILESSIALTVACLPALNHWFRVGIHHVRERILISRARMTSGSMRLESKVNIVEESVDREDVECQVFHGPMKTRYNVTAVTTQNEQLSRKPSRSEIQVERCVEVRSEVAD